jgi:hypothetical protein
MNLHTAKKKSGGEDTFERGGDFVAGKVDAVEEIAGGEGQHSPKKSAEVVLEGGGMRSERNLRRECGLS